MSDNEADIIDDSPHDDSSNDEIAVDEEDVEQDEDEPPETRTELLQREVDDQDDDPLAEEETPQVDVMEKVSYTKCNAIPFAKLVEKLEGLLQSVRNNQSLKDVERLQRLLPAKLLHFLRTSLDGQTPESIFPLYRLLMPEKDSSRFISMKESLLADLYVESFGLPPEDRDKLRNYGNPMYVSTTACGDFSAVLEQALQKRCPTAPSDYTLKDINDLLDDLKDLKVTRKTGHDWKDADRTKKIKLPTLKQLRIDWLTQLRIPQNRRALSALEHKWLVRIILRKLQFGIGSIKLLNWYDPRAIDLWNARSTLKRICRDLAFAPVEEEMDDDKNHGPLPYLSTSKDGVEFGTEFDCMRSERTGFQIVLTNLSGRHREHFESQTVVPLAAMHPAFSIETKLDGERMLVHFRRDGVVRMHSRSHVWYSKLYSPVLGPALRRAVGRLKMDMILDGEVLAWDSVRNETVPFGNNRTIANIRRVWMERRGMCDDRDLSSHNEENEGVKAVKVAESRATSSTGDEFDLAGEQCWLQFVAFDVLYLDGVHADEFIRSTVSPSISPSPTRGSLIGLDCMERKKLLYRLVEEQPREVEIVETHVVRPNGKLETGRDYFSVENPLKECGNPVYTLDSIACCMNGEVRDLSNIDAGIERRKRRSDDEISQSRAFAVNQIYKHYVEDCREEGLIFKDLSTFYVLGEHHRSKRYWLKFKPDYFNGSVASDLDVVIVGAYFASGLRSAGRPSSFLCACVDTEDPHAFLPLTKVNARSVKDDDYQKLLSHTGYSLNNESSGQVSFGHWYMLDDHKESLPAFISHRSNQQRKSETGGWNFSRMDIPDLWIDPEHSVVVTLNAGEIVSSEVFSAGLTLRFPRITRLRMDGDAKSPYDIESDERLWQLYETVMAQRSSAESLTMTPYIGQSESSVGCRFLTENQSLSQKKISKTKGAPQIRPLIPDVQSETSLLSGRVFTVLEGRYSLQNDDIDVSIAKQEGWYEEASKVKKEECVQRFIKKHGGSVRLLPLETTYLLGGMVDDVRVLAYGRERIGGVIRWSYVFNLVARLKSATIVSPVGTTEPDIRDSMEPTILDYLIRPRLQQQERVSRIISRQCKISNVLDMMRALDSVGLDRKTFLNADKRPAKDEGDGCVPHSQSVPWQQMATRLPQSLQEIIAPKRKSLWPAGMENVPVVLYPDVFRDNFGALDLDSTIESSTDDRWNSVESTRSANQLHRCVPLAKAMGAIVTCHCHSGVTHVLCHLPEGQEWALWDDDDIEDQIDLGLRESLEARLHEVCDSRTLVLLTPEYLNRIFD